MNIGDRVQIVNTDYYSPELQNGCQGEIVLCANNDVYLVKMADMSDMHPNHEWAFYGNQIEVI